MKSVLVALLAGVLVAGCSAPAPAADAADEKAAALLERIRGDFQILEIDPVEKPGFIPIQSRTASIRVWHRLHGTEQTLLATGPEGTRVLVEAIQNPSTHPWFRERCLRILSQAHDPKAPAATLEAMKKNSGTGLRTEGLRVLAMSRDPSLREPVRALFCEPGVPLKRLLWTLAMLGDARAEKDFLALVDALVRVRPPAMGPTKNPLPEVPSAEDIAPVLQPPYGTPLTLDLCDDLSDLSLLENPEVVGILIEALSSQDVVVLRTAEFLLEQAVDGRIGQLTGVPWKDPVNLMGHKTYSGLAAWWTANQGRVQWDPARRKFTVKPR